jgi:hypothetical protein
MISMRGFGMLCAATFAAALVPAAGLAAPGEAARPRVVVVNAVDLPDSLADIRAQLRTTLNDAVTKHGYDLASEAGSCADRECLKVAAVSAGATDVLVATGGRNDMRGYHVELRIWNVASDREDNAVAECNICAAQQMVDNVQNAADPLLDRVPTLHANLSATAVPPAVTVEPAPGAVPLVAAPDQVPETKSRHRWLGWTLIGAGVAAGAVSGILIAVDGNNIDNCMSVLQPPTSQCAHQRTTLVPGIITAGLSAAALVGGIVYLVHGSENHPGVALFIQPFGVTLGGRL